MNEDIEARIRRLYAAIGETGEDDLSKFPPALRRTAGAVSYVWNFRGEMTDEQMSNTAHSAIAGVANLRDHLRRWAKSAGRDPNRIDAAVGASPDLQILIDLCNAEKHGYPPRDGGLSGRAPRLTDVNRSLRISPRQPGEAVELLPSPQGIDAFGSPALRVVISGTVVDAEGKRIGNLSVMLEAALRAWEQVLQELGLAL